MRQAAGCIETSRQAADAPAKVAASVASHPAVVGCPCCGRRSGAARVCAASKSQTCAAPAEPAGRSARVPEHLRVEAAARACSRVHELVKRKALRPGHAPHSASGLMRSRAPGGASTGCDAGRDAARRHASQASTPRPARSRARAARRSRRLLPCAARLARPRRMPGSTAVCPRDRPASRCAAGEAARPRVGCRKRLGQRQRHARIGPACAQQRRRDRPQCAPSEPSSGELRDEQIRPRPARHAALAGAQAGRWFQAGRVAQRAHEVGAVGHQQQALRKRHRRAAPLLPPALRVRSQALTAWVPNSVL